MENFINKINHIKKLNNIDKNYRAGIDILTNKSDSILNYFL